MTLKQASEYLGLTVWAIREEMGWLASGCQTFPQGKKQYIDRDDLEVFQLINTSGPLIYEGYNH